jgi:hypothetical protein
MEIQARSLVLFFATLAASAFWLGYSWGGDGGGDFPPVTHKLTRDECGSCHMAYPAGLLPARSWVRMMGTLDKHFGEDASLPPAEVQEITRYLTANAADNPQATLRMRRIASGIARAAAPLRFTETPYFGYVHDEVPSYVWKRAKIGSKANCIACHTRADSGSFDEREIKIPKD